MDIEAVKKAFIAGQDASFREQVAIWVSDETISDEKFSALVGQLEWDMGMLRIKWFNQLVLDSGVDTPQQDD